MRFSKVTYLSILRSTITHKHTHTTEYLKFLALKAASGDLRDNHISPAREVDEYWLENIVDVRIFHSHSSYYAHLRTTRTTDCHLFQNMAMLTDWLCAQNVG